MAKKKTTADKQIEKAILNMQPKNIVETNTLLKTGSTDRASKNKVTGPRKQQTISATKTSDEDIKINASQKEIDAFLKNELNRANYINKPAKDAKWRAERNAEREREAQNVRRIYGATQKKAPRGEVAREEKYKNQANPYYGKSYAELTNLRKGIDARLHSGKITQAQAEKEKNTIDMWRASAANKDELSEMLREAEEYKKHYTGVYNDAQMKQTGYSRGMFSAEIKDANEKRLSDTKGKLDNIEALIGQIKSQQSEYETQESYDENLVKWGKVAIESGASDEYVPTEKMGTPYDIINTLRADKSGKIDENIPGVSNIKNSVLWHLTDGELKLYNTLHNIDTKEGTKKADEFIKDIEGVLKRRLSNMQTEEAYEYAQEHPILGGARSVVQNVAMGLPAAVDNVVESITGDIDTYDATSRMLRTSQAAREGGAQYFTERFGETGGLLYNTGVSIVEYLANVLLFKGAGKAAGALISANMASSAASNAMISTADRGGNDRQILMSGVASGIAEYLFEKISIERLLSPQNTKGIGNFVKNALIQSGVEGSEETFTEIANIITDSLIMQGQSENARKRREYVMQGMSAEEATKKVMQESVVQVAMSAAAGALSGGVMGAGAGVVNNVSHSSYITRVGEKLIDNPQSFNRILQIGVENGNTEASAHIDADTTHLSARQAGKMAEGVITDALTRKGDIASIARIIGALEGRDASYLGSKESFDTARAVLHFVNESTTKEDTALLERSSGAITVLTAIEGNTKAWGNVKSEAVKDAEYRISRGFEQARSADDGVQKQATARKVGLVMNEAADELDKGVRVNIQTFAERTGSTVVIEHGLVDEKGESIMGAEKDGVIRINADYADVAHSITVHEFTHRMQDLAPKASEKFKNYVVSKMKNEGTYESAMAKLREDYQGLSDEKLVDELCAETAERLFRDEAELTDFIKKDRTLAEWVKDAWLNVLDMLGRTDERTHAQLIWKKCVKEATKAKDKDVKMGEVRYKKSNLEVKHDILPVYDEKTDQFTVDENIVKAFGEKVDAWLRGEIDGDEYFELGKTPIILKELGASNLPVVYGNNVMWKMTGGKHAIAVVDIKKLPQSLNNPLMVFKSSTVDNAFVIITELLDKSGDAVIAAIHLNKLQKRLRINRVASVYGKENIEGFLREECQKGNLKYVDKIKSQQWSTNRGLQLPELVQSITDNNSILQKENVVNKYFMQNGENNSASTQKRPGVSEKLDEYIKDFGEMQKGADPRREVSVPKRTEKDNKVRRTARTASESLSLSEAFSEDVLESVAEEKMSYTPKSDREALNYAYSQLEIMGSEWVAQKVNGAIAAHSLDKDTVALSEVLLQHYDDEGMRKEAQELIVKFAAEGTRMGQSIQAIGMLKKLSRDYELVYVDKIIENLQEDIIKKSKGKAIPKIEVSEELRQGLTNAKSEEERTDALEKIYAEIAEQLPKSWVDRWNEWRYFSMLANARTHVRNVLGNTFFMPMIATKNVAAKIAEGIGTAISGGKMERSKTFFVGKEYRDFAKQDVIDMRAELTGGGKHNPSDIIKDKQKLFPKGLDWLMTGNEKLMEYEDWIFLKHHYKVALSNYLAANKIDLDNVSDEVMQRARYRALTEAQRNTYRDLSDFARILNKLSKQNKGLAFLVEGLMPFKKTPINVLKRGVSYSPAGLVKALFSDVWKIHKGDITASEWIDSLAQGLTGCGVVALGVLFSSLGYIEGASGDDKEKEFEELQGAQNYSLVIGEHSYTLDWLAPFSLPFFVGVEIMELVKRDEKLESRAVFEAVLNLAEPMLEMSMLSGLADAITTTQNASDAQKVMEITTGVLKNYIGQGIPTLFGQIARVIDDTRRTVYDDKNSAVPGVIQRASQTIVRKIPGATKTLQPYVDNWGRKEITDGVFKRALINMLSPGYYSKIETSDMETELQRLYDEVGNEEGMSLFPSRAVKSFELDNGLEKKLTAEEYSTMQEAQGQSAYKMLSDIVGNAAYEKFDDMVRGKLVTNVYKLSRAKGKKTVSDNEWTPSDKWIKTALALIDGEDYSAAEDFLVYHTLKNLDETGAEKEARSFAFENLDNIPDSVWQAQMSESATKRYNEFIKDSNIGIEQFVLIQDYKGGLKTIDKDTPNEITPKEQMIEYLDDLNLSTDDYRRVWQALGYSLKTCPR